MLKKFLLALAASPVFFGASAQDTIPRPYPVLIPRHNHALDYAPVNRDIAIEQYARTRRGYTAEGYVSFAGTLEYVLGQQFLRSTVTLWKDSTVQTVTLDTSNNYTKFWQTWMQLGACFDPHDDLIWDTLSIKKWNEYSVDSIGLYYNYERHRDSFFNTITKMMEPVVDTMIIQWSIVAAANQFVWKVEFEEVFGTLGHNRNTGLAEVPASQIVKIPLTHIDTTGEIWKFYSFGLPNRLSVPAGGIIAAVVGYRSGVPNQLGDTLLYPKSGEFALAAPPKNQYNLFRIRTAIEPHSFPLTSRNNGLLMDKEQSVRDRLQNFGSRYLPTSYYLPFHYPEFSFHFTTLSIGLGANELKKGYGSELFPNPTQGVANIAFALPKAEQVSIQVLDLTGKVVMTVENNMYPAGKNQVRFETSALKAGMYLYSITAGGFVQTAKFIVAQ